MSVDLFEIKIPASEAQLGMHVIRLDRPWEETDFMLQGFVVKDQDEINALREQCQFIYVEGKSYKQYGQVADRKPAQAPGRAATATRTPQFVYINKIDVSEEIGKARESYKIAKSMATSILSGIRIGKTLDINKTKEVVDDIVDSLLRNDDALMWLSKIRNQDEYTAEHCLNVCILSAAFAKRLGLPEDEIRLIGLCGMLHDVGKMKVPLEVLNKPTSLTPDEFELMRRHAEFGRDILMSQPGMLNKAVDVAYNHHERLDGNGYPRKLKANQIPYYAKLVAIVDTYDAITSNRSYSRGRASMEALDIIYRFRGTQFDDELAKEFIKMIGIYPPGSIVELHTGEVGIVVMQNPKSKLKPKIVVVLDAQKRKLEQKILLDLLKEPKDSTGKIYTINREIPDGSFGVKLQKHLEGGLILNYPTLDEHKS
ncbi:HD-GYP domain-containing protein [Allohahella sp. A8]|uniref:HD-GYP domain-containing protein n=1 Tax=Allohahella sp. A8 TaxID=3141461 RepID=UPI000C09671C|nr:phosphohydrolase [Hahellaceae bacterium]|tara:strand:+ start:29414 stop:30691 length:1278 start_codon:yes stop_codon:yes gene_type:complete